MPLRPRLQGVWDHIDALATQAAVVEMVADRSLASAGALVRMAHVPRAGDPLTDPTRRGPPAEPGGQPRGGAWGPDAPGLAPPAPPAPDDWARAALPAVVRAPPPPPPIAEATPRGSRVGALGGKGGGPGTTRGTPAGTPRGSARLSARPGSRPGSAAPGRPGEATPRPVPGRAPSRLAEAGRSAAEAPVSDADADAADAPPPVGVPFVTTRGAVPPAGPSGRGGAAGGRGGAGTTVGGDPRVNRVGGDLEARLRRELALGRAAKKAAGAAAGAAVDAAARLVAVKRGLRGRAYAYDAEGKFVVLGPDPRAEGWAERTLGAADPTVRGEATILTDWAPAPPPRGAGAAAGARASSAAASTRGDGGGSGAGAGAGKGTGAAPPPTGAGDRAVGRRPSLKAAVLAGTADAARRALEAGPAPGESSLAVAGGLGAPGGGGGAAGALAAAAKAASKAAAARAARDADDERAAAAEAAEAGRDPHYEPLETDGPAVAHGRLRPAPGVAFRELDGAGGGGEAARGPTIGAGRGAGGGGADDEGGGPALATRPKPSREDWLRQTAAARRTEEAALEAQRAKAEASLAASLASTDSEEEDGAGRPPLGTVAGGGGAGTGTGGDLGGLFVPGGVGTGVGAGGSSPDLVALGVVPADADPTTARLLVSLYEGEAGARVDPAFAASPRGLGRASPASGPGGRAVGAAGSHRSRRSTADGVRELARSLGSLSVPGGGGGGGEAALVGAADASHGAPGASPRDLARAARAKAALKAAAAEAQAACAAAAVLPAWAADATVRDAEAVLLAEAGLGSTPGSSPVARRGRGGGAQSRPRSGRGGGGGGGSGAGGGGGGGGDGGCADGGGDADGGGLTRA